MNAADGNNNYPKPDLNQVLQVFQQQQMLANMMVSVVENAIELQQQLESQEEELHILRKAYKDRLERIY
jgi:hypothetical protein